MVTCTLCMQDHPYSQCPHKQGKESLQNIFNQPKTDRKIVGQEEHDEEEFVPLRKKLKRKSTGKEDNFMQSYYVESSSIAMLSEQEVMRLRGEHGIEVEGENCPRLILSFNEAGLSHEIVQQLTSLGYYEPTPIQMQSLPCILSGRDIVGNAETGSGKTLCYVLPMLMFLKTKPPTKPGEGPLAIILAPTRELVEQIYSEIVKFIPQDPRAIAVPPLPLLPLPLPPLPALPLPTPDVAYDYSQYQYEYAQYQYNYDSPARGTTADNNVHEYAQYPQYVPDGQNAYYQPQNYPVPSQLPTGGQLYTYLNRKVLGCVGGVPLSTHIPPLMRGIDVIVATPGRLIDLINRGTVKMDRLSYLVFDEADRMLSMGMEVQLRQIVTYASICPRQSVLFSATMPAAVERLVRSAVLNPIYIRVGTIGLPAESIVQDVIFLYHSQKKAKLLEVLRSTGRPPVLIFCNHHHSVDYIVNFLREEQFHVAGLHSEKSQPYRFRVIKAFKEARLDVLVATDVASRGIDVSDVQRVIVYDMPETIEDYVHRIGRTGRAGKTGSATAFLTLDCKIAEDLKKLLKIGGQAIPKELDNPKHFGVEIVRGEFRDYPVKRRL